MSTAEQIELARQVDDLRAEGAELAELMSKLTEEDWQRRTTFKDWTIYDVIAHLHFSDHMGMTTIESGAAFQALMADMQSSGLPFVEYTRRWLGSVSGADLLERWKTLLDELCDRLQALDPQERLTWAGPGMKPRMFTTARQMETWAHRWRRGPTGGKSTIVSGWKGCTPTGLRTLQPSACALSAGLLSIGAWNCPGIRLSFA
jgi:hypothetical protein